MRNLIFNLFIAFGAMFFTAVTMPAFAVPNADGKEWGDGWVQGDPFPGGGGSFGGNSGGDAAYQLDRPSGITLDASGNMYIVDTRNHRIQKWAPGATEGTTVAGGNVDWGDAANQLYRPYGIALDASGNLYIADTENHRIQKWAPGASEGVTIAGGNNYGSAANQLRYPSRFTFDASGNLYIADASNHRIQKWAPGASEGTTVAGGRNSQGSDANQLNYPRGIILDASGNIYIATDGQVYSSSQIYETLCSVLGKNVPNWKVPLCLVKLIALISPTFKSKINKLMGDEIYSSKELEAIGFKPKLTLRDINETSF